VTEATRRPINARQTRWAAATARWLAGRGVTPNAISLASIGFAALAGGAFVLAGWFESPLGIGLSYFAAALAMQGRLLCNLFDGMVAVEGGRQTKSGEIYNELPDRFADAVIFVGAGFTDPACRWLPHLGWGAAVLALITAYVRTLGAAAGAGQCFQGPMAKQHRMALLTAAALGAIAALPWKQDRAVIAAALGLIIAGCAVTIARRCRTIVRTLENR